MKDPGPSLDFTTLGALYASGALTPSSLVDDLWRRCEEAPDSAVWIHRLSREELRAHALRVEARGREAQPLYGLPFAIKDNIDLAGAPTTAGCPPFAYQPSTSATVVARLIEAGAIPIGKTNLDQFATGLVGTRSPYGVPRNPFHPDYIPGGSSSGSAVAVATGLASFALGTDTAGSGRVPAAFNNLVGLKPTRGWLSARGVVPACQSIDCVSVFALTVEDAGKVARLGGIFDPGDPYARKAPPADPTAGAGNSGGAPFRFGVPAPKDLEWFGDAASPALFAAAVRSLEALGGQRIEIDFTPFRAAARLLYEGPWVAERWVAIRDFHARHADAIFPVTRRIIEAAGGLSAADAFAALHELEALRRAASAVWERIDTLVLPTAATIFTRAQIEADPVRLNSQLGYYTNFANLLDCAALAVPAGFRPDGLPFGITFFGPAWTDARLETWGEAFHRATGTALGATGQPLPKEGPPAPVPAPSEAGRLLLAVVGAHLRGQPLNHQLTDRGGRWVRSARTADCYRLYALAGTTPPKPGLLRVGPGGGSPIEIEVWSLDPPAWAAFAAAIPPPLGIGTLLLEDGSKAQGFLCESIALAGAEDITPFGGWRAYLRQRSVQAPEPGHPSVPGNDGSPSAHGRH
jgi:allophanate hydrolase